MRTLVGPWLVSTLLIVGIVGTAACGGSTETESPRADGGASKDAAKHVADGGAKRDARSVPEDGATTCNLVTIVPPILSVTDAVTGAPICDATATAPAGGAASLAPCTGVGCSSATCEYNVVGLPGIGVTTTILVTAPGYGSASATVASTACGCDQSGCAASTVMVALEPHSIVDDAGPRPDSAAPPPDATSPPRDATSPPPDATSPPPSGCPTSAPTMGSACSVDTLYCDYGTSLNPNCNDLWECVGSRWQDMSTGNICPPPSATCPAAFMTGQQQPCAMADESELCAYPQGTCICTSDPGGLPLENGPVWSCAPPTMGCPAEIPELGSSCPAGTPADCDYGQCSGGVGMTCVDGYWTIVRAIACAA
jgi:hypothetical protein